MKHVTFKVSGMSCQHCVMAVTKRLQQIPGVERMDVQVGDVTVDYNEAKTNVDQIKTAIVDAGYTVVS